MLTVITGGMFAEKSTELQRRGRRLERAGKKVGYFKPEFDDRYSKDELVTHNGERVPAINIKTTAPVQITSREYFENFDVFCIDEVQFFNSHIITAIDVLLKNGKTVIVAGLDLDFEAKPFFLTASLMAVAEDVLKLKAVCVSCGSDSWVSYKVPNGQRIQLGTDEYKPMCRKCFNNMKQGAN
jgi:thymidine kinase